MKAELKEFLAKYESKIILILGFILVSAVSFEVGIIKSSKISQKPVIIEKLAAESSESQNNNVQEASNSAQEGQNVDSSIAKPEQNCAYVGSKNSNKYHLPSCRWAKNIKPENVACFKDKNDAESRGYLPDKNCIK